MASDDERDEIKIGPEIAPGVHAAIRRDADGEREIAIRPSKAGCPLPPGGEIARMDPESRDGWHSIKSIYKRPTSDGPAQVATPRYREGYDRIFGTKQKVGSA